MSRRRTVSRRTFLGAAAGAVAAPLVVPAHILGLAGATPPSEKLIMGVIGCGGMGNHDLDSFMGKGEVQMVAVCDVDAKHLDETAEKVNKKNGNKDTKKFRDYREILAVKEINAFVVATPDHWHAL